MVYNIELKDYQRQAASKVVREHCKAGKSGVLLFHHMGTGKTLNAISIAENMAGVVDRVVVICPKTIRSVWKKELQLWNAPSVTAATVKVLTYEDVNAFAVNDDLPDVSRSTVIVDECHHLSYIGELERVKLMKWIASGRVRVLLSGTPANEMIELSRLAHMASRGETPAADVRSFNRRYISVRTGYGMIASIYKKFSSVATRYWYVVCPLIIRMISIFKSPKWETGKHKIGLPEGTAQELAVKSGAAFYALSFAALATVTSENKARLLTRVQYEMIADDVKDYVSFVEDPAVSDSEDFPTMKEVPMQLEYSNEEIEAADDLTMNDLSRDELEILGMADDDEVAFNYRDSVVDSERLKRFGRNISLLVDDDKSTKLRAIVTILSNNPSKKCLVYLDGTDRQIRMIAKGLAAQGIMVSVYTGDEENAIDDFSSDVVRVLVSNVCEGYSLKNCELVVFYSPPMSTTLYKQAIGRARRLNSHTGRRKKHVDVYVLINVIAKTDFLRDSIKAMVRFATATTTLYVLGTRALTISNKKLLGDYAEMYNTQYNQGESAKRKTDLIAAKQLAVYASLSGVFSKLFPDGQGGMMHPRVLLETGKLPTGAHLSPKGIFASLSSVVFATLKDNTTSVELEADQKRSVAQAAAPVMFGRDDMKFRSVKDADEEFNAEVNENSRFSSIQLPLPYVWRLVPASINKFINKTLTKYSPMSKGPIKRTRRSYEDIIDKIAPSGLQRFFGTDGVILFYIGILSIIFHIREKTVSARRFLRSAVSSSETKKEAIFEKLYLDNHSQTSPDYICWKSLQQNNEDMEALIKSIRSNNIQTNDVKERCRACDMWPDGSESPCSSVSF